MHHIFKVIHQKEMGQKHLWKSNKTAAGILLYLSPHQFEHCEEGKKEQNWTTTSPVFVGVCTSLPLPPLSFMFSYFGRRYEQLCCVMWYR